MRPSITSDRPMTIVRPGFEGPVRARASPVPSPDVGSVAVDARTSVPSVVEVDVGAVVVVVGCVVDVVDVVEVVVVVVVVAGGETEHASGSGDVTGWRTTLVAVPVCTSKICDPVWVVSKNTIGDPAEVPVIEPCSVVVPVNRYWPVPVALPSLVKSPPVVIASGLARTSRCLRWSRQKHPA
jgi:hypothetical protein